MIKAKHQIPSHISKDQQEKVQMVMKNFIDSFKPLIIEDLNRKINQIFKEYSIKDNFNKKLLITESLNRIFAMNKQMMKAPSNFPEIPID
jgi:putative heme iron utilization protein